MSSASRNSFISSFPNCMPFISFSSFIKMSRTSSTMFSKSGESRHPYPCSNLREKAFSFSSLSVMLAKIFIDALYQVEVILYS